MKVLLNQVSFFSVETRCFCESLNSGTGKTGIICEKKGTFVKVTSCVEGDFCVGPSSKEKAFNGTRNFCSPGNLIKF